MHHSSNGYSQHFSSDHHEKQRWSDSLQAMDTNSIPLPNGWNDKQRSIFYHFANSARVALSNVRRLVGHYWRTQDSKSHMLSSKPSLARDSSFSTPVFVLLCSLWYTTSALSSNTGKAILNQFRYPITLTFIQFGFIAMYCLLFMSPLVRFSRLRLPTKAIIHSTLPMGMFQVGGHMFSSMAISRIHVSTVHTIKVSPPCVLIGHVLNFISGTLTFVHRRCLCPPIWCEVLKQNLYFPTSFNLWSHACLLFRRFCI